MEGKWSGWEGKFSWEFEGRRRRRKFDFRADGKATCVRRRKFKSPEKDTVYGKCKVLLGGGGRKSAFRPVAVVRMVQDPIPASFGVIFVF